MRMVKMTDPRFQEGLSMHVPKFRLRRPRYADVASTLALVLALGGTAYAAATVHTADIADSAVTNAKVANSSIGTGKLIDGSIAAADIGAGAVIDTKLGDGAVTNAKLGDGSVTNFKLGSGSVTHSKIGANAIDSSNVASNSLTLADLLGANITGAIGFTLAATHCGDLALGVAGAAVGQSVLMTATGTTALPASVVLGFARVTSAGHIVVRACNVSAST